MDQLTANIKHWAHELGFQGIGIADTGLTLAAERLKQWLIQGRHGNMDYMSRHGELRAQPEALLPGTLKVISVRMNYLPSARPMREVLADPDSAYIARYALGRDYHKLMRQRLQRLADRIRSEIGPFHCRALVDSAPVLEKPLGEKAGIGWIGKHTNLISRQHGSWFFLGELYTDLPLPADASSPTHCGRCRACIDSCPTGALVAPYQLDARLCISYLTIEHKGSIPISLRSLIGNRIYGCDDCQLVCPWNRFAPQTTETDFHPRHGLDDTSLLELFAWDEPTFLYRFEGSAIRRIGHQRWQRNLAVALGNAPTSDKVISSLLGNRNQASDMVREHIDWALQRHQEPA